MILPTSVRTSLLTISLSAFLAACGGGSGDSTDTAPVDNPAQTEPQPDTNQPPAGDAGPVEPGPDDSSTDGGDGAAPGDAPTTPDQPQPGGDAGAGDDVDDGAAPTTPPAEEEPQPAPALLSAQLTWDAPATRADGSCLASVSRYRVSWGLAPNVLDKTRTVDAADLSCGPSGRTTDCGAVTTCSYTVEELESASWYFAVQAIDDAGKVSDPSNQANITLQ